MMYYMNWVLTNAQIELIASDVSVVDYGTTKKRKKGEHDSTPADKREIEKANKAWKEKYGDGKDAGKGIKISDVLGGGMNKVGIKLT